LHFHCVRVANLRMSPCFCFSLPLSRLRQLCCHPQISDTDAKLFGLEQRSLEEIREVMIGHKKEELANTKADLIESVAWNFNCLSVLLNTDSAN